MGGKDTQKRLNDNENSVFFLHEATLCFFIELYLHLSVIFVQVL